MTDVRALEQLRQEREAFDHTKIEVAQWSKLTLRMGYTGIAVLADVAIVSGYVVLNAKLYSGTLAAAAAMSLVDIASIFAGVFKLVLQKDNSKCLAPVTTVRQRSNGPTKPA